MKEAQAKVNQMQGKDSGDTPGQAKKTGATHRPGETTKPQAHATRAPENTYGHEDTPPPRQATEPTPDKTAQTKHAEATEYDPITAEAEKRLSEIKANRAKQANRAEQASDQSKHQDRER